MPTIRCANCGKEWIHDAYVEYSIESCPNCGTKHEIRYKGPMAWYCVAF